jgi:hypothetical protein
MQIKEIGDLSMAITHLLDNINFLGSLTSMAMALQQIPDLEELKKRKKEKEVSLKRNGAEK